MKHNERVETQLEYQADMLLKNAGLIYDRSTNPTGDLYTEKQITNKQAREIPSSSTINAEYDADYDLIEELASTEDTYFKTPEETDAELFDRLQLTDKQKQVAQLLLDSLSEAGNVNHSAIARQLGVSRQAVEKIIKAISKKVSK